MDKAEIEAELHERIGRDLARCGGALPERVAIAWRGYCAGLLEWDVITIPAHDRLLAHLPHIENDPVRDILLGRDHD